MKLSNDQHGKKKEFSEANIFPVEVTAKDNKENLTITTSTSLNPSKEELIRKGFYFHSQGNLIEAIKYYQNFINKGFTDHRVFSNYGVILKKLGN